MNLLSSIFKKKPKQPVNPYTLIWYHYGWGKNKIAKNNLRYWEWEIKFKHLNNKND